MRWMVFAVVFARCFFSVGLSYGGEEKLYVTWDNFEADKLACIWLIPRFIEPHAAFEFLPKDTAIDRGIPFDTPYGFLRRSVRQTTFQSILRHYQIEDNGLSNIALVIHDIEINNWGLKLFAESNRVDGFIRRLLSREKNPDKIVSASTAFFEQFYQQVKNVKMERLH